MLITFFKNTETGGYFRSIGTGELPGVLVQKRNYFTALLGISTNDKITNGIQGCLDFIDAQERSFTIHDEDILNRRGY